MTQTPANLTPGLFYNVNGSLLFADGSDYGRTVALTLRLNNLKEWEINTPAMTLEQALEKYKQYPKPYLIQFKLEAKTTEQILCRATKTPMGTHEELCQQLIDSGYETPENWGLEPSNVDWFYPGTHDDFDYTDYPEHLPTWQGRNNDTP